ncbi:toll/interleukin-1 receptor domain-containing adapter protein-like [Carassius carassius]|uniref:toll/interleukin-1 receptor domain-containing adapter protein-like n=1 Tax=Carassius carassius TaxID=217509 RepID=UPI0028687F02|nr:toll/interleukin-1 receptor domain-containing adapter protein-like [Carassius carassius]
MEGNHVSSIMSWFRQRFGKQRSDSDQVKPCKCSQTCSSNTSSSVCSSSSSSSSVKSSISAKPSASDQPLPSVLSSPFRSSLRFDVLVCHNDEDSDLAQSLASFLEAPSNGLRCYLQERDCPAGGAVSTELLQAIQDSHCWLLLVTPNFVKDDWCKYQMHQVLSEGPMSQRIIPAVVNMPRSQLPLELRFLFTVDLNTNKEFGYTQVYRAVFQYLKDMSEKKKHSSASQSDG